MSPELKRLPPEAADPFDGPHSRPFIDLDRRAVRLIAGALVVFWLAVGCAALTALLPPQ